MARPCREEKPKAKFERPGAGPAKAPQGPARWVPSASAVREFVESVVIAVILALLIRAFQGEVFVVPTGSMAPTLMGRHRDVACPQCGYPFRVNASHEVNDTTGELTGLQVISGTCPMCRFTMDLSPENTLGKSYPSYSGDRLIVGKYNYQFGSPRRWDVAVFHFPLRAKIDYIKRVVGLPSEALRIEHGEIWVRPKSAEDFTVERKPPPKVLAMMQPVYDNDYAQPALVAKGLPPRWAPMSGGEDAWTASADGKSFQTAGKARNVAWLGYQHIVPRYEDWQGVMGAIQARPAPKPQLITDFNPYDSGVTQQRPLPWGVRAEPLPNGLGSPPAPWSMGMNWVGDLVVEFEFEAAGAEGEILVELVKGGRRFGCRLDLAQGKAELSAADVFRRSSSASFSLAGKHRVRFANVDQQLLLWIDPGWFHEGLVAFEGGGQYEGKTSDATVPTAEDLTPVRIGSRGAQVAVSHLRIYRDIYYIAQNLESAAGQWPLITSDLPELEHLPEWAYIPEMLSDLGGRRAAEARQRVAEFFSDPGQWKTFQARRRVEFQLGEDQFFMLGDNSAESADSRLWDKNLYYVDRDLLVGEAICVFWPHSWNRIPGTPIPFPLFPNFSRMRFVR